MEILKKNLMILASAGSGKTYQLGNRVIGLVGAKGVDPRAIVALTFTRKAAGEFADSVLTKLGEAVLDPAAARQLEEAVGEPIEVATTLESIVMALPRFQLGTMDGFFSRVVRGFQYELGLVGGKFELIQGPRLEAALEEIFADILGHVLEAGEADDFLHAFKRATMGREERSIQQRLSRFFHEWQGLWKSGRARRPWPMAMDPGSWEEAKRGLAQRLRRAAGPIQWTDKRQPAAFAKMVDGIEEHAIGSGSLGRLGGMFTQVTEWAAGGGPLVMKHYKVFEQGPMVEQVLREAMDLLTACELKAAVERTGAVIELVERIDRECDRRLRRRGLLGFDDVKLLMGSWAAGEEQRLRREAVDFRLDARYQHWLLDEFQDTSQAEWLGLEPLLDEAASDPEGSLFVVGDVKQAIYGWRGGDVKLFDEIRRRYQGDLGIASMPESWRSCESVLDLVNEVCGDLATIELFFGPQVAARWPWERHLAAREGITGESRVEVVAGQAEERLLRTVEILRELGMGRRSLSCGVLVRTNDQLKRTAEFLRAEGFDVIEEGSRRPGQDHPVGVAMLGLLGWLADPADRFCRGVMTMTPLEARLKGRFESDWDLWEGLLEMARGEGFSRMMEWVMEPMVVALSEFGRRRVGDLLGALAAFDASGGVAARAALRWVRDLEVPQSPGAAAVQVMTIHKSKGLGFDVVILPEIEDKQVPDQGAFRISTGGDWALQNPASWVRAQVDELRDVEAQWQEDQCYEMMCVLYVALTRAKRGLYVLLPEVPASRKNESFASPANWIRSSLGIDESAERWQSGDPTWWQQVPERKEKEASAQPELHPGTPMRSRMTPSGRKMQVAATSSVPSTGKVWGTIIHELLERIEWLDEVEPTLPDDEAGNWVRDLLQVPELRAAWLKGDREIEVYREQPIEVLLEGKWMSGVVDRLHVHEGGRRIEILDFKTDAVDSASELIERYADQMKAYQSALQQIYPEAEVVTRLLSTKLRCWIALP